MNRLGYQKDCYILDTRRYYDIYIYVSRYHDVSTYIYIHHNCDHDIYLDYPSDTNGISDTSDIVILDNN